MTTIVATYTIDSTWDLDAILSNLGITRESVVRYFVKYDALKLTYKDAEGNILTEDFEPDWAASEAFDYKYPTSTEEIDE
jgi:hypothetical protein